MSQNQSEIKEFTSRRRYASIQDFAHFNNLEVLETIESKDWNYGILYGNNKVLIVKYRTPKFFIKSILAIEEDIAIDIANVLTNLKQKLLARQLERLVEEAKKHPSLMKQLKQLLK